jgi:hypothetical protein
VKQVSVRKDRFLMLMPALTRVHSGANAYISYPVKGKKETQQYAYFDEELFKKES